MARRGTTASRYATNTPCLVRDLQRQLKAQGVQLLQEADESTQGPASFVAVAPDGNPILVDQACLSGVAADSTALMWNVRSG